MGRPVLLRLLLAAALLAPAAVPARAAESTDPYIQARDAFIAGKDEEVIRLLPTNLSPKLRNHSHAALWAALSRARLGRKEEASRELQSYHAQFKENAFIDLIITYYLGLATEQKVISAMKEDWQRCEGGFYLGAYALLFQNDVDRAKDFFCTTFDTRMTVFSEYKMAQSLLPSFKEEPPCAPAAGGSSGGGAGGKTAGATAMDRALAADSLGQREQAITEYRAALKDLNDHDKAALVRSRIYTLSRELYDAEARDAVSRESQLSKEAGPDNTVAVVRFINTSDDMTATPLEKGLPALLSTDLAQVKKLTVLERVELESVLNELKLSSSDLVDSTNAPRVGHLVRAGRVVTGSFAKSGVKIEMDARVVDVRTGAVEGRVHKAGVMKELFSLEKDLVFGVLDQLGVHPTPLERNTIQKQVPTTSLVAFMAYSRGLDLEDRGDFEKASAEYRTAAAQDPGFRDAAAASALTSRGTVSRNDLERGIRPAGGSPASAAVTHKAPATAGQSNRLLDRAFDTERLTGSGLIPDLGSGEAHDRRDSRPAGTTGTVVITGRLP